MITFEQFMLRKREGSLPSITQTMDGGVIVQMNTKGAMLRAGRMQCRMPLCPKCGNKRCPKGTDHRNACTGSNEPGQAGSDY